MRADRDRAQRESIRQAAIALRRRFRDAHLLAVDKDLDARGFGRQFEEPDVAFESKLLGEFLGVAGICRCVPATSGKR